MVSYEYFIYNVKLFQPDMKKQKRLLFYSHFGAVAVFFYSGL